MNSLQVLSEINKAANVYCASYFKKSVMTNSIQGRFECMSVLPTLIPLGEIGTARDHFLCW